MKSLRDTQKQIDKVVRSTKDINQLNNLRFDELPPGAKPCMPYDKLNPPKDEDITDLLSLSSFVEKPESKVEVKPAPEPVQEAVKGKGGKKKVEAAVVAPVASKSMEPVIDVNMRFPMGVMRMKAFEVDVQDTTLMLAIPIGSVMFSPSAATDVVIEVGGESYECVSYGLSADIKLFDATIMILLRKVANEDRSNPG